MNNLCIIGAGQLGSRHLQGISKLSGKNKVYILDPSIDSLNLSKSRLGEAADKNPNNSFYFIEEYSDLPRKIELAIISTNADARKKAVQSLVKNSEIKSMILEKFLFQKEGDYFEIRNLLNLHSITAWVNCPRRVYPEYKELRNTLQRTRVIEFVVTGSNWALASNSIHLIDLFAFFLGISDYKIHKNSLIDKIYASKRKGYIEFNGSLVGEFKGGVIFSLNSYPDGDRDIEIKIETDILKIIINQEKEEIIISDKTKDYFFNEMKKFPNYFQSNLSGMIADEIINSGTCGLTKFDESFSLHLPLLRLFKSHYQNVLKNENLELCPIT